MGGSLLTGPGSSDDLVHGARLQGDAEHCIIDLPQGPPLAERWVGAVSVGQGEEHGVVGQEDQPPVCQALGPRLSQKGRLLRASQERRVHAQHHSWRQTWQARFCRLSLKPGSQWPRVLGPPTLCCHCQASPLHPLSDGEKYPFYLLPL